MQWLIFFDEINGSKAGVRERLVKQVPELKESECLPITLAELQPAIDMARSEFAEVQVEGARLLASLSSEAKVAATLLSSPTFGSSEISSLLRSSNVEVVYSTASMLSNLVAF